MSRTIKFRVWDKEVNLLIAPNNRGERIGYSNFDIDIYGNITREILDFNLSGIDRTTTKPKNNYIIQEFTGLPDKNGVEIFEGDIITYESNPKEVIWYEPDSAWRLREKNGNVSMSFNGWLRHASVVGNIFENPELLTK